MFARDIKKPKRLRKRKTPYIPLYFKELETNAEREKRLKVYPDGTIFK
jgi:hypothetical protein